MKKNKLIALSFLLATVMILSTAVTVSAADTIVKVSSESYYVRKDQGDTVQNNSTLIIDSFANNERVVFLKFDLTGIDLSTLPGMKLRTVEHSSTLDTGNVVDISIMPESVEDSVIATMTYNTAKVAGLLENAESIGTIKCCDTTTLTQYSTDILNAIKADVQSNDNIVVLRLNAQITETGHTPTYFGHGWAGKDYPALVASTQAEVDEGKAKAQADADAISIPNTAELGSTITLPTEGTVNTSKITWTSDSSYINADTGVVASKIGFANEIVTLTATSNYNGLTATKAFQITLAGSNMQVASDCTTIRGYQAGDGRASQKLPKYLMINHQTSDNRTQGVMRFDITGIKKEIDSLEDISLRLTIGKVKVPATPLVDVDYDNGRYFVSILPDNAWTTDTMTLDYAITNNLISGAAKAGTTGTVATKKDNTIVFDGLKDDIKKFIENNPTATSISFLLTTEATSKEDSVSFYVMGGTEAKATEATQPLLIGETAKRFNATNNNGAVTFTYNVDSAKYPTGINMPATFFAAEYDSSGKLVNVAFEADADSKLTNGEAKTLTINGFTSGNKVNAMIFNNLTEIMPMQPVALGN